MCVGLFKLALFKCEEGQWTPVEPRTWLSTPIGAYTYRYRHICTPTLIYMHICVYTCNTQWHMCYTHSNSHSHITRMHGLRHKGAHTHARMHMHVHTRTHTHAHTHTHTHKLRWKSLGSISLFSHWSFFLLHLTALWCIMLWCDAIVCSSMTDYICEM